MIFISKIIFIKYSVNIGTISILIIKSFNELLVIFLVAVSKELNFDLSITEIKFSDYF